MRKAEELKKKEEAEALANVPPTNTMKVSRLQNAARDGDKSTVMKILDGKKEDVNEKGFMGFTGA